MFLFIGMSEEFFVGHRVKGSGLVLYSKKGEDHGGPIISPVSVECQNFGFGSLLQKQPGSGIEGKQAAPAAP